MGWTHTGGVSRVGGVEARVGAAAAFGRTLACCSAALCGHGTPEEYSGHKMHGFKLLAWLMDKVSLIITLTRTSEGLPNTINEHFHLFVTYTSCFSHMKLSSIIL